MELEGVDASLPRNARHFRWRGIDEHADREHGSLGRGRSSGRDAGPGNGDSDLPSRWSKDEPDEIRSSRGGSGGMLRLAQAVDLDDSATGEKPEQSFPVGVDHDHANSA
jgi:hypothetical protein